MQTSGLRSAVRRHRVWIAALALCVPGLTGCFEAKYEQRLETAKKIYEHYDLLNQNLTGMWTSGTGIQLRVPKQFGLLAGPPPRPAPKPGETASTAPVIDPRQPDYLPIELPGLLGAWHATLRVDTGEESADRAGYLYVLSNQYRNRPAQDGKREDPAKFHEDVVKLLSNALQKRVEDKDWVRETYPASFEYSPKVTYQATKLIPDQPIGNTKMKFELYQNTTGGVQTVILYVLPEGVSNLEKLNERIPLSLETLLVEGTMSGGAPARSTSGPQF